MYLVLFLLNVFTYVMPVRLIKTREKVIYWKLNAVNQDQNYVMFDGSLVPFSYAASHIWMKILETATSWGRLLLTYIGTSIGDFYGGILFRKIGSKRYSCNFCLHYITFRFTIFICYHLWLLVTNLFDQVFLVTS